MEKPPSKREIKEKTEWECGLYPPVLQRYLRVKRDNGTMRVSSAHGATKKEVRLSIINQIRGGVLEYSNAFDRECGDDPKIKVPESLR